MPKPVVQKVDPQTPQKKYKHKKPNEVIIIGSAGFATAEAVAFASEKYRWYVSSPEYLGEQKLKVWVIPWRKEHQGGKGEKDRDTDDVTVTVANPDGTGTAQAQAEVEEGP